MSDEASGPYLNGEEGGPPGAGFVRVDSIAERKVAGLLANLGSLNTFFCGHSKLHQQDFMELLGPYDDIRALRSTIDLWWEH